MTISIPASGYYYANKIGRILLQSMRDQLGQEAFGTVLHESGLDRYLEALPPDNFDKKFDFAEFSMLNASLLQQQTGAADQPSLPFKVGEACFQDAMKAFGGLAGLSQPMVALQVFPLNTRLTLALKAMAIAFGTFGDQVTETRELADSYVYAIHRCPVCWGRHSDQPTCIMAAGLLSAGLKWMTAHRYRITETECCAAGAESCTFVIDKTPLPD